MSSGWQWHTARAPVTKLKSVQVKSGTDPGIVFRLWKVHQLVTEIVLTLGWLQLRRSVCYTPHSTYLPSNRFSLYDNNTQWYVAIFDKSKYKYTQGLREYFQSLISKVFCRYLHSPRSHQSSRFLKVILTRVGSIASHDAILVIHSRIKRIFPIESSDQTVLVSWAS